MADYVNSYPQLAELQMKYDPMLAANAKATNEQLYPETAGLQEQIAGQAKTALSQGVPDWYQANVADTLKSQMGRNLVYNPQAQEQYGVATQQANMEYGNYWRNLALSAAGRQPLATGNNQIANSYTPQNALAFNSSNYGTQAGMYNAGVQGSANVYGNNMQNYTSQSQYNPWANMAGSLIGGVSGAMTAKALR
jgi:hypothetical protein